MAAKLLTLLALASLVTLANCQFNWQQAFFGNLLPSSSPAEERQNILVHFSNPIQPIFDLINRLNFTSFVEKRLALTSAQKDFANTIQAALKQFLRAKGAQFDSFWISNKIVVKGASSALTNLIRKFPGVSNVEPEPIIQMGQPIFNEAEGESHSKVERQFSRSDEPTWGIKKIRADEVWKKHSIDGWRVVVACIDTGVRHTHESLHSRWRKDYGWFDPYDKSPTPHDRHGHGTHVMATIAGGKGIGVAPFSTWVACKGLSDDNSGTASAALKCGEWIQCPTDTQGNNPDCSKAPHVVANSWGSSGGGSWYNDVIKSWQNAGILPIAALMNSGPECSTGGTPGDAENIVGVGNLDSSDRIAYSSSLGPTKDGRIKPDIVAPGTNIYSASHRGDREYTTMTGTSMACPHVAGVAALMLEKKRNLKYNEFYDIITKTAVTNELDTNSAKTCGGIRSSSFPNNVFGYGRIDALNAINAL